MSKHTKIVRAKNSRESVYFQSFCFRNNWAVILMGFRSNRKFFKLSGVLE